MIRTLREAASSTGRVRGDAIGADPELHRFCAARSFVVGAVFDSLRATRGIDGTSLDCSFNAIMTQKRGRDGAILMEINHQGSRDAGRRDVQRARGVELGIEADLANLRAQEGGEAKQILGVHELQLSLGDFFLDALELLAQPGEFGLMRGENLFLKRLDFEGAQGAKLGVGLLVPIDERARAHIDLGGDAREAPALGAEGDELSFGVVAMHAV